MEVLNDINDNTSIDRIAGKEYETIEKIKLGGSGSQKICYVKGISEFDSFIERGEELAYTSFEIRPSGLIGRLNKSNQTKAFVLHPNELNSIHILTRPIKIHSKFGKRIAHDAVVTFKIKDRQIVFYCPVSFFKDTKKYFHKDWLKNKTIFKEDADDPINDYSGLILETINRLLG